MSDDGGSERVPTTPAPTTFERLTAQFATSEHATVKKGGAEQTYAPWTEYVERLNAVLEQGWSFRVIREGFTPTECWVLGEIEATIDGVRTVRQQYGCEPIAVGQSANGDLLKKAASDAVKKAASLLGIGLYLSVKEEREAVKAAMRTEVQAEAKRQADERAARSKPTPPTPINDAVRDAAVLTGANPQPTIRCRECGTDVSKDSSVTILKKKAGPKVTVPMADFEPVCAERLGAFHCAGCYDRKYWGVA